MIIVKNGNHESRVKLDPDKRPWSAVASALSKIRDDITSSEFYELVAALDNENIQYMSSLMDGAARGIMKQEEGYGPQVTIMYYLYAEQMRKRLIKQWREESDRVDAELDALEKQRQKLWR